MKKIYKLALENAHIKIDDICRALDALESDNQAEKLVEIILNIDIKREELADIVKDDEGVECKLRSFNYIDDDVIYHKLDETTKYFKDETERAKYVQTGVSSPDYSWNKNDEYCLEGTYIQEVTRYCRVERWLKWMRNKI